MHLFILRKRARASSTNFCSCSYNFFLHTEMKSYAKNILKNRNPSAFFVLYFYKHIYLYFMSIEAPCLVLLIVVNRKLPYSLYFIFKISACVCVCVYVCSVCRVTNSSSYLNHTSRMNVIKINK